MATFFPENVPPASVERGMVLAAGGALLRDLDERLRQEMSVPAHVTDNQLACVAVGSRRFLEGDSLYRNAL